MSGVGQLLTPKVLCLDSSIAHGVIVVIATSEALDTGRRLYQGPIHTEVLVRHQSTTVCLIRYLFEQFPLQLVSQQPSPVLGEHRRVEARLHQVHIQEPAIEQVVVELLAEGSLTPVRIQRDQQQRLQQTLGMDRCRSDLLIHTVEVA